MAAVFFRWPNVLVQFEDFQVHVPSRSPRTRTHTVDGLQSDKAIPMLQRYRSRYRCFNDDIQVCVRRESARPWLKAVQGTGAVTLAGLLSAVKLQGGNLTETRVLCAGAGSAGLGVCSQLLEGMVAGGLERDIAQTRFMLCTDKGIIGRPDGAHGNPNHAPLNVTHAPWVNTVRGEGREEEESGDTHRPRSPFPTAPLSWKRCTRSSRTC